MKKVLVLVLIVLMPGLRTMAQQTSEEVMSLTLEHCIEYALKNNYNRQSVALNEASSKETYNQSKMERLPNLTATIGETFSNSNGTAGNWNGNYSLNTGLTIYQGGYINSTIEKSKLAAEQSTYLTAQYNNDLTIQVLQAFLTALGNEELLRYQDVVLKASEEQLKQGKARLTAGEILESDYLLLEAQYASDLNNILETTISRDNSLNALKSLMSLDLSQSIEIVYPDDSILKSMGLLPSEDEVIARSFETLPDLEISKYSVEIAEAGVRISRSAYAPTLSLNASIGSGHINDFSNYSSQISDGFNQQVGLSLNIPLFNRNRTKSSVTKSRIALQQAELEYNQTELEMRQLLVQEFRNVVLAESVYRSTEVRKNAYLASFDAYRMKFTQGSITAVELLQQQNNYISAMNDYVQGKYGFILKRKVLDVYMGEPVTM